MSVDVRTWDTQVTTKELGLTRDRFTKSLLRQTLETKMSQSIESAITIPNPPNIQSAIDDFADRLATGAPINLQNYFNKLHIAGYTASGKRASSQPMLYEKRRLLPSSEDIGAIGEGIAGYYLENYEGLVFEVRPFGVSPDFVFRKPAAGERVLVEVKTSLHSGDISMGVAIELLDILAKTKFIRQGKYIAYVVQVNILSPGDFQLYRLGMEEV